MKKRDDGGPAFPMPAFELDPEHPGRWDHDRWDGMSLRDWLAGQALAGLISTWPGMEMPAGRDALAQTVYSMADAMLVYKAYSSSDSQPSKPSF